MKLWSALFNMIAVILMMMLTIAYFNVVKVLERDFDQERLNLAVGFATRAMFEKTLEIEDLGMDYSDLGNVQINSSDALDTFTSLMCISYDMSTSEENRRHVENSIAAAVLASGDGFYITQTVTDDVILGNNIVGDGKVLRWSPKIPYILDVNNRKYAVDFVNKTYASVNRYTNGASNDSGSISISNNPGYPLSITDNMVTQSVNNQIVVAVLKEMERSNENQEIIDYKFYLPLTTTAKGVNPITEPSVLLMMSGVDFASTHKLDALSVSGFRVTTKVNVLGIRERATGRRFYCYETQIPFNRLGDFEVEDYFSTITDAAIDPRGYTPHYEFIKRKVTK